MGASSARRSSASPFAGEGGRGEHVLVERRSGSLNAGSAEGGKRPGLGAWGSSLFETRGEGGSSNSINNTRRRPSSPALSVRNARPSPRGRTAARTPEPTPREPTPPLTLDSIQSTYNPFPLFHIRMHQLPEVALLVLPLLFALLRLHLTLPLSPSLPSLPLPFAALSLFTLSIPFIALFRRTEHYFQVPFTDSRGYRDPKAADDGIAVALALPLLLALACYLDVLAGADGKGGGVGLEGISPLVAVWESQGVHALSRHLPNISPQDLLHPLATAHALLTARHQLVLLTALNSAILVLHLVLAKTVLRIERLPKSNTKRFFGFMATAMGVSSCVYVGFSVWDYVKPGGLPISPLESFTTTLIQQSSFYIVSRLARRGFTLGELNTMTIAGNALCLEFWRLSRARWLYKRGYPTIPPTFRSPTPVIAFQSVLIPGAFLSGFLLSPLLVISRHIASRPSHRLKWPTERDRHRRLLAIGVFLGLFGIVFLMLGGWASWMLGNGGLRRPWIWAAQLVYFGGDGVVVRGRRLGEWTRWRRWKRLGLVAWWMGCVVLAVGGWQTRLVRARRIRMRSAEASIASGGSTGGISTSSATTNSGSGGGGGGGGAGGEKKGGGGGGGVTLQGGNKVGAELAREEKRVHASLNMRRKFFHALAVLMFVPGIAVDPAFTSLAFSVAFSLFTFSEYARYFALYPIGAPLHIFFSEFIDSKDSGPVILSHFYLLTGCAGGLWLEGRGVNRFTGVLVLGVGDALASIVGKYLGRLRWPGTSKTVEGTTAFVLSIAFCAWLLRVTGLTPPFSMPRYLLATTLAALLEASSSQNDNLIIPLYMWSMVTLLGV
ncbi:hypothetical protein BCR35DRAFT_81373 [Leucosporidium creatinivorum]|uniref:dolichol kinase n=1 Tax=Leucosporidium creatinivorum TaxID=106004 RepID=A0A1Y2FEF8_9BASI|nr:hypothetical protein BCR35DRAFT_81373 [Leucosporidium creatinivorum]